MGDDELDATSTSAQHPAMSELSFREMADGLPFMIWVHDSQGRQEMVNQTFCEFFGVTREEMKGGRWQALMHPDDADEYREAFAQALADEKPFHAEVRVKHADGSWRRIESWGRPRRTNGRFRGFVGTSIDVTERRQTEESLRESEARFRALADNLPQLAWMARGDGWIYWYNRRWYEYTGTTLEEMEGWGWKAVHHPDHLERVVTKMRESFDRGVVWEDTFPMRRADGEYRWFLTRAVPIRDDNGDVTRWVGTNTDVTEQREVEQRLQEADRQKNEFLAMLGHELRNPLAAIRTAAEVLRVRSHENHSLVKTQAVLERQTAHMSKLLDGLLDLSRIISGKIRLNLEPVELRKLCHDVMSDARSRYQDRDLDLREDLPPEPVWAEADRVRLSQIIDNLLSNAVKFTPDGGSISLILQRDENEARIRVRDTGVGIESGLLPHIFEIFRQSEQSLDRSAGGLGIGLALARTLAAHHGGRVEAHSAGRGRGAEFVIFLPVSEGPADEESESADSSAPRGREGLKILLVEDNEDAAEMLGTMLELAGHHVMAASTGRAAVHSAIEWEPDVVLCDLGLPGGMSGFDVARELRADLRTRDLCLVALSGYGRPEDKKRAAEVGFDNHLTKPVSLDALKAVLESVGRL